MATYKHFKLGNVVKAESNYGFDIVDEHKTPLFSIIYPTEVQAKAAILRLKQLSLKLWRLVHVSFVSMFASGDDRAVVKRPRK